MKDSKVEYAIKFCVTCHMHNKHVVPLYPVPLPDSASAQIAVETVGTFEITQVNCQYAITIINYISKQLKIPLSFPGYLQNGNHSC